MDSLGILILIIAIWIVIYNLIGVYWDKKIEYLEKAQNYDFSIRNLKKKDNNENNLQK